MFHVKHISIVTKYESFYDYYQGLFLHALAMRRIVVE